VVATVGEVEFKGVRIRRLCHAAFRLEGGGVVVYIDPFRVEAASRDGDLAICTHDHYDHCSVEDLAKVLKEDGVVVAAANCSRKLSGLKYRVELLKPGDEINIKGVRVRAVPAYNVGKPFHPRPYGGIGVVVELAGVRIYHAGDTDLIPEMEGLRGQVDVALLPVSGVYVMNAEEAVEAAKRIRPELAIPMHYGAIVGSDRDADKFRRALEGVCRVEVI